MKRKSKLILLIYFLFWLIYFAYFWSQAIFIDEAGNIIANHVNIWGDWAAHFTMGSRMAFDKLILLQSPFIIGKSFSYPFITNLISALLVRIGVNFFTSFIIPSFIFSLTTIWALFFFYQKIFKSTLTAIIASLLFLLNGGVGFIYFIQDIIESKSPFLTIINPPQQYTNIEPLLYRWISVIDSMIIPQRAFSLGFPLTLISLALCWSFFIKPKSRKKIKITKLMVPATILGLMPLIHTHSFLAAFIILATWAIGDVITKSFDKQTLKKWLPLLAGVSLIAIPIIKMFLFSQVSSQFIKWFPGWYSHDYPDENWLLFWIKNWGFIPLLAILGLANLVKNKKSKKISLITFTPFFIIFIALNLFLFQPFIWDNTKLVVWASVGFSGLAAHFLVAMWQKKRSYPVFAKLFIIVIFSISIFSGSIDAYRIVRFKLHSHVMYSREEMDLVEWVRTDTDPESIWLTGDNHNHWLFNLTGRQSLMTFRGWLWTHGYQYHDVEKDMIQMFKQPNISKNLFDKYEVDYVVIGPNEKRTWKANESEFSSFSLIKSSPNYKIYSL
jgi:hypothetical protein